jgi:hypothetical protein
LEVLKMNARTLTMTVIAVFGLVFVIGTGCSDKDDSSKMLAAQLKAELDVKQKELDCKVGVLAKTCASGDTTCDKTKVDGLAACTAAAASATAVKTSLGASTVTTTNTSGSTSTTTI